MISRMMLLAGVMGSVLSFGIAHAAVSDTNSLTTWETATGDSTPLAIATGAKTPPGSVTFGTPTSGVTITGAGSATKNTFWSGYASWTNSGATTADNVIKIGSTATGQGVNSVTMNVTGLSALGLFMQVSGSGTYSLYTCTGLNGVGCTVDSTDSPILVSGGSSGTGGIFFGYYGDAVGNIQSIEIAPNPSGNDGTTNTLVVGQFYEVSVPEPATLGLVGFGLAALGIARRRKRA